MSDEQVKPPELSIAPERVDGVTFSKDGRLAIYRAGVGFEIELTRDQAHSIAFAMLGIEPATMFPEPR